MVKVPAERFHLGGRKVSLLGSLTRPNWVTIRWPLFFFLRSVAHTFLTIPSATHFGFRIVNVGLCSPIQNRQSAIRNPAEDTSTAERTYRIGTIPRHCVRLEVCP